MFCLKCGRRLTAAESVARLLGPECAGSVAKSRTGDAPLSLKQAADKLQEFMAAAGGYLSEEAQAALRAEAQPLVNRLLKYPEELKRTTLWKNATAAQKEIAQSMQEAIEHLATVAGNLAVDGTADWRRSSDAWRPILGALDAACGYRFVAKNVHVRMARSFRQHPPIRRGATAALPPLLALMNAPASPVQAPAAVSVTTPKPCRPAAVTRSGVLAPLAEMVDGLMSPAPPELATASPAASTFWLT